MVDIELTPELRNALGKSAEIGLARAISLGQDEFSVTDFITARLSELSPSDLLYIRTLSEEIISAGEYIGSLTPIDNIDADRIPTVPIINETEWSGVRVRTPAQWSPDGGETWLNFTVDLPDITDFGDLIAYAYNLAESMIDSGSDKLNAYLSTLDKGELMVRVVGAEKAF
jgi:hypothetical protein